MRIDRWLWVVRLFKTRSRASDACRKGKIAVSGRTAKASHILKVGDIVEWREAPIVRRFRVLAFTEKRVAAKIARELVEEITAPADLELLRQVRRDPLAVFTAYREKGSGRPTKRERRRIDEWQGD